MSEVLFSEFESVGLGLERDGRMRLADYDQRWAEEYSKEAHRILTALDVPNLRIFHIGSTSITGIQAKPILDILLATPSLDVLDSKRDIFEALGYECKGEFGLDGRRYYIFASQKTNRAYVHVHAWEEDRSEILRHLIFRDYLRHHFLDAKRYEAVKVAAVRGEGVDRSKYMDMKAPVIDEIMKKAAAWALTPEARLLCSEEWQITDELEETEGSENE